MIWHAMPCCAVPCRNVYNTIQYHTIPYDTIPYHTIQCNTIPYHTKSITNQYQFNIMRYQCDTNSIPIQYQLNTNSIPIQYHAMRCHAMPCHDMTYNATQYIHIKCYVCDMQCACHLHIPSWCTVTWYKYSCVCYIMCILAYIIKLISCYITV